MDEYAGRVLAERYRLPLRPLGDDDFTETRAFDTFSGQEVLIRQVPLPEVVEAEVVGAEVVGAATAGPGERTSGERRPGGGRFGAGRGTAGSAAGVADRSPRDPAVRRALEAATTAAQLADHPRLEQVFDAFAQDGSLWIVAELLTARPLSALLAERPLSPHRAAEIAADLLTALRVLHTNGWLHRNITARTVLVCEDGRAILTGLAVGAAQEALCAGEASGGGNASGESAAERPDGDGTAAEGPASDGSDSDGAASGEAASDEAASDGAAADRPASAATSLTKPPADGTAATATAYGRPSAGLAAERARQTRLTVIGPVTERWAPEQAGPVHENWQLAPPVGPATDLWAVGALLYRSVQGQPPFPEDSAVELAQLVCSQPPAVAEECGALRPVVESLLRQDPADRPDFEELSGWLRSLIRTAPEPEAGSRLVTMPASQGADPRRLPIVRRRGELVRKGRHKKTRASRRARPQPAPAVAGADGTPAAAAAPLVPPAPDPERSAPLAAAPRPPRPPKQSKPLRPPRQVRAERRAEPAEPWGYGGAADGEPYEQQTLGEVGQVGQVDQVGHGGQGGLGDVSRPGRPARAPRPLGRLLLTVVLLLLVGAVIYAMAFLPKSGEDSRTGGEGADRAGTSGTAPASPTPPKDKGEGEGEGGSSGTGAPRATGPAGVAKGFEVRTDPEGFQVAVRKGWQRRGANDRDQVRYVGGDYELVVVPGRDTTAHSGTDPMAYMQNKEAELAPYRSSGWASASGLQRIDVGKTAMAEGTFSWRDGSGREVYVRNLAMIHNGRYHLVLVIGPDSGRHEVDELYEQATSAYRPR
ncbi:MULTISPECIES: protein kinase [unclassified Streptomyces]|uniref:protein kinase n=1 Tax=unclassified Streptomyces TaxID=2593676 RepID=UPI00088D5C47|nr:MULTISPECIES: protein kinase [unclassified Streptomyces]PBC83088.1 protein tyrosine kinase [Streptomyces sp. 2321.6]SDR45082.1 Protein tyrosine kinase [Streptomyces sp. KS_16]SEC83467.1 Protein tyrosine kinase [Streptomyces sp. 2133.1]SNC69165.1 Protein tyrosine kinase [Streptomyces sp. 2114.4]